MYVRLYSEVTTSIDRLNLYLIYSIGYKGLAFTTHVTKSLRSYRDLTLINNNFFISTARSQVLRIYLRREIEII